MTREQLIDKYVEAHADNRWLDAGELRDLLNSFADELMPSFPSEISLEKFTEKMDDWKARFNYPDRISIKATMAFTGRMFYMYSNVAREWYESLPYATQDAL